VSTRVGPLAGVRILDAASLLAAPTTASFLSEFGAEVIKIEQPGTGDTMRRYPPFRDGVSLLWKVVGKNRRSLTLDLRKDRGREVLMELARSCDVVLLNFRPETLAKWNLEFDDFVAIRDDIIVLQLTAYGRTGPYANRPGFARVAEAFSGLTFRTGFPDSPPSQSGYPMLGDGVAGMYGAFAVMLALRQRDLTGEPQLIDLGLYEPMFRILEDQVAAYAEDGTTMERIGNSNPLICPNGMFPTKDDRYVCIPASTQTLWHRLVDLMGRPDLLKYDTNPIRIEHREEIEGAVADWTSRYQLIELVEMCAEAGVACGPVYSSAEIASDPHIKARGSIIEVPDEETGESIHMASSAGRFSGFEAQAWGTGPALGAHTTEVLSEMLGYSDEQIDKLRADGAV
jgi:crotonobetainyl-CoA:carnitine CoA-transferase CaiB-like acyl-CoA transferase